MALAEQGAGARQTAARNKLFTDAARAHPGDFLEQAKVIVSAQRPPGVPRNFTPLNSFDWQKIKEQQERLRQEQEAQRRQREQQRALEEARREQGQSDQRAIVEQKRREMCDRYEREVRDVYGFAGIAQSIAKEWQAQGVPVQVSNFRDEVREQVGITITYTYPDVETEMVRENIDVYSDDYHVESKVVRDKYVTRTCSLFIGIGKYDQKDDFFHSRGEFLFKFTSSKAYFVNGIPVPIPDAEKLKDDYWRKDIQEITERYGTSNFNEIQEQEFHKALFESGRYYLPAKVLPSAKERVSRYDPYERTVEP